MIACLVCWPEKVPLLTLAVAQVDLILGALLPHLIGLLTEGVHPLDLNWGRNSQDLRNEQRPNDQLADII